MSDWIEELEKINGLKEKGILSDDEFLEEKQRVLASRTMGAQEHSESSIYPTPEEEGLSNARINLLAFSIFCYGIVGFVASFFDIAPNQRILDLDAGVTTMVGLLFFSLITLSLIYFSKDKEKISNRVVGFVLPFSITIAFSELWLMLCMLLITPGRNDYLNSDLYSEDFQTSFWIILVFQTILIFVPIWKCVLSS